MAEGFDSQSFRKALGTFTTGVTIVTTVDPSGMDVGVTANSFNSVSLDPPMVLWSLAKSSTNMSAFVAASHYAVHILAHDQDALATRFSKKGLDRFAGLAVHRGTQGIALLDGCAARFECRTAFQYQGGDHIIFVGEVEKFDHADSEPLVFKRGRFAVAVGKGANVPVAAPPATTPPGAFEPDFLVYLLGRAYHQLYGRIKPEIARRGLDDAEYFALSMLGVRDGRSRAELDELVSYTGANITESVTRHLATSGLIDIRAGADGEPRLWLSVSGRRNIVELLAVAEAAATDAEKALDPGESRVLRQLLTSIIEASDPGVAHPWLP